MNPLRFKMECGHFLLGSGWAYRAVRHPALVDTTMVFNPAVANGPVSRTAVGDG